VSPWDPVLLSETGTQGFAEKTEKLEKENPKNLHQNDLKLMFLGFW